MLDQEVIETVAADADLADLVWRVWHFTLERAHNGAGGFRLASGLPLTPVAGDWTGGAFFLCGETAAIRPVLYASSEGSAAVIGRGLAEALQIMIGLPSWHDCLGYSGGGDLAVMGATLAFLLRDEQASDPGLADHRERAARALSFDLAPPAVLLGRLHAMVSATRPDFELLCDGEPYESTLFGPWHPSRNSAWR
ncbi:hypothetical protein [Nocardia sp. NPDC004604]|uniref:hypothetical protein n=1 Tax=Nocardia sp. NPDC004604 TaxID=3157013 RepID=UPI0033A79A68